MMPIFCLTWGKVAWARGEARGGWAAGITAALSALNNPRSLGPHTGNLIPLVLWSSVCAARDFCKHLSPTFNRSTLSKQTLSSTPTLAASYCCQGQWFPLQSPNYSPWSLTHFLSGEPWHQICRPEAGSGASYPRVCFSSLSSGRPRGCSAPLSLHSAVTRTKPMGRKPSGPAARPVDGLASIPCSCLSPHPPCPHPQEETLSIPDACSFVDSSSPQLQMVWIHFSKWLCL